jgi:hypothetical protein
MSFPFKQALSSQLIPIGVYDNDVKDIQLVIKIQKKLIKGAYCMWYKTTSKSILKYALN